jgi:hypothetical protein
VTASLVFSDCGCRQVAKDRKYIMVTPVTPVDYHSAGQTGTAGGSMTQATQNSTAASLADLLGAGAEGDQRAFEQLYQRTSAKLLSVCFHLLRRRDLAEEVLQEAYLRIWRGARGYHPGRGAPMTWMISIARNAAIDRLRQTRRQLQEVDSGQDEEAFPEPVADLRDEVLQNDSTRALGAWRGSGRLSSCLIVSAIVTRSWPTGCPSRWARQRVGSGAACLS